MEVQIVLNFKAVSSCLARKCVVCGLAGEPGKNKSRACL